MQPNSIGDIRHSVFHDPLNHLMNLYDVTTRIFMAKDSSDLYEYCSLAPDDLTGKFGMAGLDCVVIPNPYTQEPKVTKSVQIVSKLVNLRN